jgi:hypothetical protein
VRKSAIRLYAPFIALALIQAMFITFAPSRGPGASKVAVGPGTLNGPLTTDNAGIGSTGSTTNGSTFTTSATGAVVPTGSAAGQKAELQKQANTFFAPGGPQNAVGDRSHCSKDGRQTSLVYSSPPCVPKWPAGADNGGATAQRVTKDAVKVVLFNLAANSEVNAILATQGLAEDDQTRTTYNDAAVAFLQKHYEFYGRKIQWIDYVAQNCPTTPPNPTTCDSDVKAVIDMHPFAVVAITGLYSNIFDEFAHAGILTLGGEWFEDSYFTKRAPYRYDALMDGTTAVKLIGDYYCSKMAGKTANHAGAIIHQSIGPRDTTKRKVGITTPDDPANVAAAKQLVAQIEACDGPSVTLATYASDITRADEQATATTTAFIHDKVTTVICLCDPIAPAFGTKYFTKQQYFPEILTSGEGFTDYDKVGRLYDQAQMAHAFGPSELAEPVALGSSEAGIVWHDTGNSGDPCQSCNLNWGYIDMVGQFFQMAGPNLNVQSVQTAVIAQRYSRGGWDNTGHNPSITLEQFGPGDYTALSDVREVYWSNTAPSKVDGNAGAYISINNGQRFAPGTWPASTGNVDEIPISPQ